MNYSTVPLISPIDTNNLNFQTMPSATSNLYDSSSFILQPSHSTLDYSLPNFGMSVNNGSYTSSSSSSSAEEDDKTPVTTRRSTSLSRQNSSSDSEKRKSYLERNRQAALKCRQRKKEWLRNLQEKVEFLANDNEQLQLQANVMKDEVLNLRNMLLAHKDCHFSNSKPFISSTVPLPPSMVKFPSIFPNNHYQ
ncbi:MAG: hypothetical protein EXX96DRAFT_585597 [Benjaminiella poitrasii]|nr:MAG: hypothetical protein EXX96DRAFT_585597 [Benjaminiella poitrasii]